MVTKCIFCLARGYDTMEGYTSLRKRNILLKQNFKGNCDFIVFHEGNITVDQQSIMKEDLPELMFIDISDKYFVDTLEKISLHNDCKENDKAFIEATNNISQLDTVRKGINFKIGYSHMCHFYTIGWLDYLSEYDWTMRADDDFFLDNEIDIDLFELLDNGGFEFGYRIVDQEYHCHTVNTFKREMENILGERYSHNMSHYYSNFCVFKMSFWKRGDIQEILKKIDKTGFMYKYRWGDSPIQASIIRGYIDNDKICFLDNVNYFHGSHGLKTNNIKRVLNEPLSNGIVESLVYLKN